MCITENLFDLEQENIKGKYALKMTPSSSIPHKKEIHIAKPQVRLSYENVKSDPELTAKVENQDRDMVKQGDIVNIHDINHVMRVMKTGEDFLKSVGLKEGDRAMELLKVAAYLHDIGNAGRRVKHAERGALMAKEGLLKLVMKTEGPKLAEIGVKSSKELESFYEVYKTGSFRGLTVEVQNKIKDLKKVFADILTVEWAISKHSECGKKLDIRELPEGLNKRNAMLVALALFMGDKFDIIDKRVRPHLERPDDDDDTHTIVNDVVDSNHFNVEFSEEEERVVKLNIVTNDEKMDEYFGGHSKKPVKKYMESLNNVYLKQFSRCARLLEEVVDAELKIFVNDNEVLFMTDIDKYYRPNAYEGRVIVGRRYKVKNTDLSKVKKKILYYN